MEYARNVLGIHDAEHEESAPSASTLLISRLAYSLVGAEQTIYILPDSVAHRAYGREETTEKFACNFGFNPIFQDRFVKSPLRFTGLDSDGQARVAEIVEHPFYLATLYLPQNSSAPGKAHPLIKAFLQAALMFGAAKGKR